VGSGKSPSVYQWVRSWRLFTRKLKANGRDSVLGNLTDAVPFGCTFPFAHIASTMDEWLFSGSWSSAAPAVAHAGPRSYFLLYLMVRLELSVSSSSDAVTFTLAFVLIPFMNHSNSSSPFIL
jgi:hypothetical protein